MIVTSDGIQRHGRLPPINPLGKSGLNSKPNGILDK